MVCAGVSKYHYGKLLDSPSPLICWLCSDSQHKAVIHKLQQELAALKRDFREELDEKSFYHSSFERGKFCIASCSQPNRLTLGPKLKKMSHLRVIIANLLPVGATTRAVSKTITTLTKVPNTSFTIMRKFKVGLPGSVSGSNRPTK